jgi:hypothetical protein
MAVNYQKSTRTAATIAATSNTQMATTQDPCDEYEALVYNGGAADLYVLASGTSSTYTVPAGEWRTVRGIRHGDFPYLRSSSGNLSVIYRIMGHRTPVRPIPNMHEILQGLIVA